MFRRHLQFKGNNFQAKASLKGSDWSDPKQPSPPRLHAALKKLENQRLPMDQPDRKREARQPPFI